MVIITLYLQVNVAMINRGCHMNGTDTSSLCFSYDGQCLASRGGQIHFKLQNYRTKWKKAELSHSKQTTDLSFP